MPLTTEQKIFFVATFYANRQSITDTETTDWPARLSVFQKRLSMICTTVMISSEYWEQPPTPSY
jgi:hypothetical protein